MSPEPNLSAADAELAEEVEVAVETSANEGLLSSPHRLFALVDGVFAIAMTLLALDVRIPDDVPESTRGFADAAPAFYGHFGVFFAAFVITSRFWLTNHRIMARLTKVSNGVLERTVLFLAGISSIPVATSVLFRFGSIPAAVTFVSVLLSITSLLGARLWWYLSDPKRQLSTVNPADRLPVMLASLWNSGVYLLAIPVAYLLQRAASGSHDHVAYAMLSWLLLAFDSFVAGQVLGLRARLRRRAG